MANLLEIRSILRERFESVTVIRPSEVDVTPVDRRFLETALDTVEAHLADPDFQVADLASAVHLSESQLTRKLKAVTGQTSIFTVRPDGTGLTDLTNAPPGSRDQVQLEHQVRLWSSETDELVFIEDRRGGQPVEPERGRARRLPFAGSASGPGTAW